MRTREIIPLVQPLNLKMKLPGSKSITNRAFLCAALAKGVSRISGALSSDDTKVMLGALSDMGVEVVRSENAVEITGVSGQFKTGPLALNLGASGTSRRFLKAIDYLRDGKTTIQADKRLLERPMDDLDTALETLRVQSAQNKRPHLLLDGSRSSQFVSALLMLAPMLSQGLKIEMIGKLVSKPYVDMTIAVMKSFGVEVERASYKQFNVKPQSYQAIEYKVEADATAASYFSAINYLHKGYLEFENLNYEKAIQGDVNFPEKLQELSKRSPRIIDMQDMPDAAMTLAICALFASGETKITGLSTLKYKETDRLKALRTELKKVGAKVSTTVDSLTVEAATFKPTHIATYNDHRMAMCFAVLGTKVPGIVIENPDCVNKTYPNFWKDLDVIHDFKLNCGSKNVVLIGMRSVGKTKYGKTLAGKLKRKFVDLDHEIEMKEGISIEKMVEKHGWEYFRKIEQKMCSTIYKKNPNPILLATGGGVVLSKNCMEFLKKNAVVVFMYVDPKRIASRLAKNPNHRPSLTGQSIADEVAEVWQKRRGLYLEYADHILIT